MKVIANGPPKSGTTALTMLIEDGFGIPRTRGILSRREGVDAWIVFPDDVYRTMPLADHLHGNTRFPTRRGRELRRIKEIRSVLDGLVEIRDGEVMHAHLPPRRELAGHKVITVLRDPRDNIVSVFRSKNGYGWSTRRLINSFERFVDRDARFIPWMRSMWSWRRQDHGLVVSYETLFDRSTIAEIAAYIERDPINVRHLYQTGPNWSGAPSRWQDWFTEFARRRFDERWAGLPMEIK